MGEAAGEIQLHSQETKKRETIMDKPLRTAAHVLQLRRRGRRYRNGSRGGRSSLSTSCSSSPGSAWPRSSAGSTTTMAATACGCRRWCSPAARRSPSRCSSTSVPGGGGGRRPPPLPLPPPPLAKLAAIYAGLGVLLAGDNLMYSYGLLYLPLSTYSIICASQVSFNAVFSYFLNKEKFRALVLNSVVLLTFSAALVGVSHGSDGSASSDIPAGKFPAGFALTLAASALFSLILSLMQLTFEEVLRSDALPAVLEMQFWSNTAAALVSVAGLFASGEWRAIAGEMAAYRKGEVAVRDDAGVDGRVVAALHDGARRGGVVAVHQRDQHGGHAAVAGHRGDLPRRPDGRGEAAGHAHSRVGAPVLRLPALPR